MLKTSLKIIREEGFARFWTLFTGWLRGKRGQYKPQLPPVTYAEYRQRTAPDLAAQRNPPWTTRIAVVTPATEADLSQTYESLQAQTYPHWTWYADDSRARPLTDAIDAEWVLLLDGGDQLAPQALYTLLDTVQNFAQVDVIYADLDHADGGDFVDPWFKPGFSPEMLLSVDLFAGMLAVRRDLWQMPDKTRWDFSLRLAEQTAFIRHIPEVLVHRVPRAPENGTGAVQAHLTRAGLQQVTVYRDSHGANVVQWALPDPPPRISIIIPSLDKGDLVEQCLTSLLTLTDYPDLEVVLVDTGSIEPATYALYEWFNQDTRFKLVHYEEDFNFSRACNIGAALASGELLLFLNNDTQVLHADWLRLMAQWFSRESVGVVGAKLLYPDNTIQHAGVIIGMHGFAGHLFAQAAEHTQTIFGSDDWYRDYLAVTGACLMTSREVFEQVGGFVETYQLNYSDVELCLRAVEAGYRVVYTPHVRLTHHESATHQKRIPTADTLLFNERLQPWLKRGDPFYNPNLSYQVQIPALRRDADDNPATNNAVMMAKLRETQKT